MSGPADKDLFGNTPLANDGGPLARSFAYPPFSVLSARDGWWQERKRQWLALGIKSELGRPENLVGGAGYTKLGSEGMNVYRNKEKNGG